MKVAKYIFFDTEELARKFIQLYGGVMCHCDDYWTMTYFGYKAYDKFLVNVRMSTDEINEVMRVLPIKKKKWAEHVCYYYKDA